MWKASLPLLVLATLLSCQRPPPRAAEPLHRVTVACTVQPQSTLIHTDSLRAVKPEAVKIPR